MYTEEELERIRKGTLEQQQKAKDVVKKRGYKKNPRIEAADLK